MIPDLPPGAGHVPGWLSAEQQRWLVAKFQDWVRGPVPIRAAKVRGHEMSDDADARMGMHQDKDERSRAPVGSLSIGDSCVFRCGL